MQAGGVDETLYAARLFRDPGKAITDLAFISRVAFAQEKAGRVSASDWCVTCPRQSCNGEAAAVEFD